MTVSYPEGVARFYAVLQEEGSTHDVVDDRVLHQGVVDSVQVGRPVKRAVDAAALHVRLGHVTCANRKGKYIVRAIRVWEYLLEIMQRKMCKNYQTSNLAQKCSPNII